jgi:hypothetical protein
VAEGTDIGVDLYCEAVIQESPYLHFWAQVKAIPLRNVSRKKGSPVASYSFKTRHLRYWARQPTPVYAFLVPVDGWPPARPERVFGIRLTEYIVRNELPTTARVKLSTKECFEAATVDADISQFLTEIVPWDTSALLLRRGIVAPMPQLPNQPDKRFPANIGYQYLPEVLSTIRDASVHGLAHALYAEQHGFGQKAIRKGFEKIARLFEREMHNWGLSVLVLAARQDDEFERAKGYITRAVARVQGDQNLDPVERARRMAELGGLLQGLD